MFQNTQRVSSSDSLFYTPVMINKKITVSAMLDTGSMACTLNEIVADKLIESGALAGTVEDIDIVLIGCGGKRVFPKGACDLKLEVYGCDLVVPTLIVPGQADDLILGTNVIKYVVHKLKQSDRYWEVISRPNGADADNDDFLAMLAGMHRWNGDAVPDIVGTVRLNQAVTLSPGHEHLVWGKLPVKTRGSPGSAVVVEPTGARSAPRNILVGRVVTPLWADGWVPLKIINPGDKPVTLKRNAKIADVYPCIALEDVSSDGAVSTLKSSGQHVSGEQTLRSVSVSETLKQHGLDNIDLESCDVSDQWKGKMCDLVVSYEDIFSRHQLDCGEVKDFVHRIHLVDDRPFRLPYRRVPPAQYQKLRVALNEMEERGIIRKSTSEFASPLVLCWKKNGDLRICTDFRWLNARTVKDAHPLPHQADCLAALGGNSFFSTMDLTSGFYNVPLHEEDKKYTAFTTPVGLHEYNRLPQGLCNSPASFMRMMTNIFGDQNFLSLLCYLDDLMVFAPTEQEALKRIEVVFERMRAHNLKLSPKKCHFLRRSVQFLGHLITEEGVSTDPAKVDAIVSITKADLMCPDGVTPSVKKIQSFLGLVMWYQRFIENCSSIARPLFELTSGTKKGRGSRRRSTAPFRKLTAADWTPACERALEELKDALLAHVVLAHPNFNQPFILSTDASMDGLGAVLSQLTPGEDRARPIAFASKSLNRAQSRYPAHRLEFLALKWAVSDKFSHWLKGHSFTAWTDNNPLTHILTKPKLDACEQRWVAKLAAYEFDIKYVPGPKNTVADALSREPFVEGKISHRLIREPYTALLAESEKLPSCAVQDMFRWSNASQTVHVITGSQRVREKRRKGGTSNTPDGHLSEAGAFSSAEVAAVLSNHVDWDAGVRARTVPLAAHVQQLADIGQDTLPSYTSQDLKSKQWEDNDLKGVMSFVERKHRPSRREKAKESRAALKLLKQWEKLTVEDGILYRVSKDPKTKRKIYQYVVPLSLRDEVLRGCHDEAGHQGQFRTLYLTRRRFYWSDIERDVRTHVKECTRCVIGKTPEPEGRAVLESIKTTAPLELVCIDFWCAEDSKNRTVDVLVVTDHFTKLAHAFHCPDQTAKSVARKLWDNYFCFYGFPERIHSDQGANFESELISNLLQISGVKKSHTTAYHPMGNGTTERFNRTLGNMIRVLPPRSKQNWPQMLHTLTFMYNCTTHETTGFPPFYLMFGRVPRIPVDVVFKSVLRDTEEVAYPKYMESLQKDLQEAIALAEAHTSKEQKHQADVYNRRAKGSRIEIGDRVLLSNKGERGKRKLADKWESVVYTVVDRDLQTHIYKVKNPVTGQLKVVHRNLLLCVNFLPLTCERDEGDDSLSVLSEDEVHLEGRRGDTESLPDEDGGSPPDACLPVEVVTDSECESDDQMTCEQSAVETTDEMSEDGQEQGATQEAKGTDSNHLEETKANSPDLTSVRSRVGRIIKPVNRLIHTMSSQSLFHTHRDTFRKWAGSVLSVNSRV